MYRQPILCQACEDFFVIHVHVAYDSLGAFCVQCSGVHQSLDLRMHDSMSFACVDLFHKSFRSVAAEFAESAVSDWTPCEWCMVLVVAIEI